MRCLRCGNEDKSWFYKGSKGWYCRKCITFGRVCLQESMDAVNVELPREGSEEYLLKYPLTYKQQIISDQCKKEIEQRDVLIHAVCGAGKTELVVDTISSFLGRKKKVCFAIARRQVVLELSERLKEYFPYARIVPVCQGYTSITDGDLIICTTHQLYRYVQTFDLIILDEPDAFPFRGNDVLHGIAHNACKGRRVYLTATPDEYLMKLVEAKKCAYLKLDQRPHGKPIPVPRIKVLPVGIMFIVLIWWLNKHHDHPRIVFVPTRKEARILSFLLRCDCLTSTTLDRDQVMKDYLKKGNGIVIATTVLERGITVKHADVCVLRADHDIYDEAGLVQMAGRAGRDFKDPYGDVLFLANSQNERCMHCKEEIERANQSCNV